MKKITYRKVRRGRYFGRCGKLYIFIYMREHGHWDGFDKYCKWYTAIVGEAGEWLYAEGQFGSSLRTLNIAKEWVRKIIKTDPNKYYSK